LSKKFSLFTLSQLTFVWSKSFLAPLEMTTFFWRVMAIPLVAFRHQWNCPLAYGNGVISSKARNLYRCYCCGFLQGEKSPRSTVPSSCFRGQKFSRFTIPQLTFVWSKVFSLNSSPIHFCVVKSFLVPHFPNSLL